MLLSWRRIGVLRADLAVRRRDGSMIWHRDLPLGELPLAWARAENVRLAEVYVRPARGYDWPVVFLDDVGVTIARRIAQKYTSLVVLTSPTGGCHVWLACGSLLDEADRGHAQLWLTALTGADPRSASGEHLGRLAGFKNWKRGGTWVNLLGASLRRPWDPTPALRSATRGRVAHPSSSAIRGCSGPSDPSDSGRDWAWVCRSLELGDEPESLRSRLAQLARPRRGSDADRYAHLTVTRALAHVRRLT